MTSFDMNDNVKALPGYEAQAAGVDQNVIGVLERMLARAKAGNVTAIAGAALGDPNSGERLWTFHAGCNKKYFSMLGCLEQCKREIQDELMGAEEEEGLSG